MNESLVIVMAGAEAFALPSARVDAVFRVGPHARVPLAAPEIAGIVQHRGRMITAVCLRRFTGGATRPEIAGAFALSVTRGGDVIALIVDSVDNVVRVPADRRVGVPAHYDSARRAIISCVYAAGGGLLPVLDADALFQFGTSAPSAA